MKVESDNMKKLVSSSVLSFKSKKVDQMILDKQREMNETDNHDDYVILLQESMSLKEISVRINKDLTRVITK